MDDDELLEVPELECDVCGERTFQEREGYYYCLECGTKKEQMRAVEISAEDTFNDASKHTSTYVIKKPKVQTEEDDMTSWEFYNYILRGFVQELLQMGAKPELKLMTLQVWAAYMDRMEVAFCKNNEYGLPKLNVRALQRDAQIIYNHRKIKRKRERNKKNASEPGDERANWRIWRKTKRKLDQSGLSGGKDKDDNVSESTMQTNQTLKLQWSTQARKSIKKYMSLKHLDKHSADSSGSMNCHSLHPKAGSLNNFDRHIYRLDITKLFVVLAIALNQIEDSIQLSDLLRFIDEEHLSSRFMLNYFPENVAMNGKSLIREMEIGHQIDKCSNKFTRQQIVQMSRFINLNGFIKPDLKALTRRYVLELNLPPDIASYVDCLMDTLPPSFKPLLTQFAYPRYEARVMAYIIYVMKLLFGLDGFKERAISESAIKINEKLLNIAEDQQQPPLKPLFVFTEWMEFVELRKVLVANYSESFAKRYHVPTKNASKINDFLSKERKDQEQDYNYNEMLLTPAMRRIRENICLIFETLLKKQFGQSSNSRLEDHIEFQPSLTPAHSYFKRILLHASQAQEGEICVNIPAEMLVDHTEHQLGPFKNDTEELSKYLQLGGHHLRVEEMCCPDDFESLGIFQGVSRLSLGNRPKEYRANFKIKTEQWIENVRRQPKKPDFIFRQTVGTYGKQYRKQLEARARRREDLEINNDFMKPAPEPEYVLQLKDRELSLSNLSSMQVFDEAHMKPLQINGIAPRRQMIELTDEEPIEEIEIKLENVCSQPENTNSVNPDAEEMLLTISNFDCWLLYGYAPGIREKQKHQLRSYFPTSFRWLLETCAATIGIEWEVLYEQLLVLEMMYYHGIEDWNNHRNYLRLKYNILNKNSNQMTKIYRDMW